MASTATRGSKSSGDPKAEAKKSLILRWNSAVNAEDGTFDHVFGDAESTPYAVRLVVYYTDNGDVEFKISIPGVESGKWKKEDSFSDGEMSSFEALIEESLPLLELQVFEFAHAIYEALASFDSDPSLMDSDLAAFMRSNETQTYVDGGPWFPISKHAAASAQSQQRNAPATSSSTAPTKPSSPTIPTMQFECGPTYTFILESYQQQAKRWPGHGQHILGTFTDSAILVYQAFKHDIADYALREQKFTDAPGYSTSRMTWFKPNFMWMMYRSNWAQSKNQERILGIWLKLDAFLEMLAHSTHTSTSAGAEEWNSSPVDSASDWKGRVNIQWDPDHGPSGKALYRRAVQIGVKNVPWWHTGERFEGIIDVTPLVVQQRKLVPKKVDELFSPQERLYTITDKRISRHVKLETTVVDLEEEKNLLVLHKAKHPRN